MKKALDSTARTGELRGRRVVLDERNTDQAWVEEGALHLHDDTGRWLSNATMVVADAAAPHLEWVAAHAYVMLPDAQLAVLRQAVQAVGAYFEGSERMPERTIKVVVNEASAF